MTDEQNLRKTRVFSTPKRILLASEGKLLDELRYPWYPVEWQIVHAQGAEGKYGQLEEGNEAAAESRPHELEA